ncbi:MAG: allantoate amidohydrolase [Actinomycetia bacterium]|nr:allantoate amidohydrolase [Actinomycetes bacterium]
MTSFDQLWSQLEPVGRAASGGYRRFAWTAEDLTLREWFAAACAERGLDVTVDRAGNQWGWWGDPDSAGPGVAIGSHLDSVPDGGAFDGPLGVVSALLTVDALRRDGVIPERPLGVVNFADEEGARFGVACGGSRLLTGALPADRALGLRDTDGTTLAGALRTAGRDPGTLGADAEALRRVGCFVELHVEQGRGLADLGRPVAVGTAIWGHGRWRFDLPGEANHAGTTALADRRDPTLALATLILRARELAGQHGVRATTGKVLIEPNGVNAIPSLATGWLDARGEDDAAVRAMVAEFTADVASFGGTVTEESWTSRTPFDTGLTARLGDVLGGAPYLPTGAGHDAGILASADVPSAMLFVRNPTGVSHSPAEFAETGDCLAGVRELTRVVEGLLR